MGPDRERADSPPPNVADDFKLAAGAAGAKESEAPSTLGANPAKERLLHTEGGQRTNHRRACACPP